MQHLNIPLEKVIGRLQQLLNTPQESLNNVAENAAKV